jgi:hypothetical protein
MTPSLLGMDRLVCNHSHLSLDYSLSSSKSFLVATMAVVLSIDAIHGLDFAPTRGAWGGSEWSSQREAWQNPHGEFSKITDVVRGSRKEPEQFRNAGPPTSPAMPFVHFQVLQRIALHPQKITQTAIAVEQIALLLVLLVGANVEVKSHTGFPCGYELDATNLALASPEPTLDGTTGSLAFPSVQNETPNGH